MSIAKGDVGDEDGFTRSRTEDFVADEPSGRFFAAGFFLEGPFGAMVSSQKNERRPVLQSFISRNCG
jgi:hypothetical protein